MLFRSADSVVDLNQYLPVGYKHAVATGMDADGNVVGYAYNTLSQGLYVGGDVASAQSDNPPDTKIFITRLFPDGTKAQTQIFGDGRESLRGLAQSPDKVIYASGVSGSLDFLGVARVSSDLDGFLMKLQP